MKQSFLSFFFVLLLHHLLIAETSDFKVVKDIVYAKTEQKDLKLDLYLPKKNLKAGLIVYIHGGAWLNGNKNTLPLKWLLEKGYPMVSISYRFSNEAIFPAQMHDCKAAIRWCRANAKIYGVNAENMIVSGSSAGGQLAALLGTSAEVKELEGELGDHLEQSSRVQGVIDFYGASDFVLRSKTQPDRANKKGSVVYKYFGGGADVKVELAKLASAAYQVTSDDPPMLVFHGDKDNVVLLDQSERINEVYKKAGLPIELHILKGAGHGGNRFYGSETEPAILSFVEKILK